MLDVKGALTRFFSTRSVHWITGAGLVLTALIALAERLSIVGNPLWVLYLVPIGFVAWYGRWQLGAGVGLASLIPLAIWPDRFFDSATGSIPGIEITMRFATAAALLFLLRTGKRAAGMAVEELRADPSTGLANARALFDLVAAERERADRYGRHFTLVFIGIDDPSTAQSQSGAEIGEDLLREIALQIRATVRGVDYVARIDDREFAILLPETGADSARAAIYRIGSALADMLEAAEQSIEYSVGMVSWIQSDLTTEALHRHTYRLMKAARLESPPIRHEVLEPPFFAGVINDRRMA